MPSGLFARYGHYWTISLSLSLNLRAIINTIRQLLKIDRHFETRRPRELVNNNSAWYELCWMLYLTILVRNRLNGRCCRKWWSNLFIRIGCQQFPELKSNKRFTYHAGFEDNTKLANQRSEAIFLKVATYWIEEFNIVLGVWMANKRLISSGRIFWGSF